MRITITTTTTSEVELSEAPEIVAFAAALGIEAERAADLVVAFAGWRVSQHTLRDVERVTRNLVSAEVDSLA